MNYVELKSPSAVDALKAKINKDNGQLCSLVYNDIEYMHPGGRSVEDPQRNTDGWTNSEIIMFPIVGQSQDNTIIYDGKKYPLDQHGIIRAMTPEIIYDANKPNIATLIYRYEANSIIDNSARHKKDTKNPEEMHLPFGFELIKTLDIRYGGMLQTSFAIENIGESSFGYAMGWHPAFLTNGNPKKGRFYNLHGMKIDDIERLVIESKKSAHTINDLGHVRYVNRDTQRGIELGSTFDNVMLWAPNEQMFCIEPITDKRKKGTLIDLSSRFFLNDNSYNKFIEPEEKHKYSIWIVPNF